MTSHVSSEAPSKGLWSSLAPYLASPLAAAGAIVLPFVDMIDKTTLQKGLPVARRTFESMLQGIKGGIRAAPSVGVIVGAQMALQSRIERALQTTFPNFFAGSSNTAQAWLTFASAAAVGALSSPLLAIYNGKTMTPPWSVVDTLSRFSFKQAGAIALQETGFVAGLAAAGPLSRPMKQRFGDSKVVEYSAAAIGGALGSLVGHAGNTALTRWQNRMMVENIRQLSWGALTKARGNALFALLYRLGMDVVSPAVEVKK